MYFKTAITEFKKKKSLIRKFVVIVETWKHF